MKIFLYIGSLTSGGAERVTVMLAERWVSLGHEVSLVTMQPRERDFYPIDSRVRRISLEYSGTQLFEKIYRNIKGWHKLRKTLKVQQPEILVAIMTPYVVLGVLAACGLAVRVYGSERNNPVRQKIHPVWAILRRFVYPFAHGHIAQTPETAKWLRDFTGARNIQVIPNPVTWPIRTFPPKILPEGLVSEERKILLAVGTKPRQKGFDLLIEAFSRLAPIYPGWDLVILGIEPQSEAAIGGGAAVLKLAESRNIAHRLFMPGRVGNILDWYHRADIFVLSSRYEGMPNVLLEAMASGCASVAFDCDTGPRDIIQDGVNGALVQPENVDALAASLLKLMVDESLRREYAKNGLKVAEMFSEAEIIGLWEEAIGLN